jgi:hypothetical protein
MRLSSTLAFMKKRAGLLLMAVLVAACAAEPPIGTAEWQGRVLREVRSLAQLPPPVHLSLGVAEPGLKGVADRGQPFNATDVVDTRLPRRRFIVAGYDDETWLVAIEHGGRGYHVEVFLFIVQHPIPRQKWVLLGDRPNTLVEVVRQISAPKDGLKANKPLERPGVNTRADIGSPSAIRSAPSR